MISEESINFLKSVPPFQFLDEAVLKTVAENLSMEFIPRDSLVLTQEGPPSGVLRVIKKGGVKVFLIHDGEIVLDYKGRGDSFGYVSLISGDKSRVNVKTIEDSLFYQIPRDVVLRISNEAPLFGEYFMKSFLKNYLDKTYREMRNKNLLFKEGEKLLYTTPVKNLLTRGAVTAPPTISIKDAANTMSVNGISSIILTDEGNVPCGIVTDRDLRDRVVSKGIDPSQPVQSIMSSSVVTVDSGKTCFDALAIMMKHNIHHLVVTDGGRLGGMVTNHDFMILQGTSPLSILKNIDRQKNAEGLLEAHNKICRVITILLKEGVKAGYILRIITELHDRLLYKFIELSLEETGEPSGPFAFFVYGNEGRKEQTFKTVFHCALCYEDHKSYSEKKEMERFSQELLSHLQRLFTKCGLPLFESQPFGKDVKIFGQVSDWQHNVLHALRFAEGSHVEAAKKILDMRAVYGYDTIIESLRNSLYEAIRSEEKYYSVLADVRSFQTSPVGFIKKFIIDEKGEQLEKFNIKDKGIAQIVDSVRSLAVIFNLHETSTIDRLNVLKQKNLLKELHSDIHAAFEFLLHMRLEDQVMKKEQNLDMDDVITPEKLSLLEKKTIKEIFTLIPRLQDVVRGCFKRR
jgi:CBS domain-containing protein